MSYNNREQRVVRILFVCHGNICRSPMAEFVMKDLVCKHGLGNRFYIQSAATSTEEIGNPVHRGTRKILSDLGIDCSEKHARRITKNDYADFDLIIGMDEANMRNMMRMFGGDPLHKVHKLMEFAGANNDVADPWYTGDFDRTYDDVLAGCAGLLSWLGYEN